MILIKYSVKDKDFQEVMVQLETMTLDHKTELHDGDLQLIEGKQRVTGKTEILKYLDGLSRELHSWYYCNC